MTTSRDGIRVLSSADLEDFLALAGRDPVVNVFALHRAQTTRLEPRWLGGEMWGRYVDGTMVAACHSGANIVPVQCTAEDARLFADRAISRGRAASTLVGPHEAVRAFWNQAARTWGTPRERRWLQPHLELSAAPSVEPDTGVRRTTRADLETLYPACVAMYTEEVGVSPVQHGSDLYRARVLQLVDQGWSFARFEDGELVFKAEVACATEQAAQVQGVYVPPQHRGRGLATTGMAAVSQIVRDEIAPTCSLYVNEWNGAARQAYERAGFVETARFSTVMF